MNILKRVLRIISYVLITCSIIGLIFCAVSSDRLRFVSYDLKTNKDVNFSCLVISDYHHRSLSFKNGNMIDMLEKQNQVDYVFFVGDLIDSHSSSLEDVSKIFDTANKISKKGCYFVTGNHEEYAPRWSELQELMEEKEIEYLNDEIAPINESVQIFGLQDPRFHDSKASFKKREAMVKETIDTKFKSEIKDENFNVLLVHRPENFKMIAKNYNFDMVIAGHTHGGQFKLGNWIPSSIFQEESDYMGGKYHKNNSTLFVSRGLGYSAMFPIRVNCEPEIVKITVSKA